MSLGKRVGTPPRELAQQLVDAMDVSAIAESPEIAGPGFINIRLKTSAIADALTGIAEGVAGGESIDDPHPVVIDLRRERRQADARRPPAFDDHRRCVGTCARAKRSHGAS